MIDLTMIETAAKRLSGVVVRTPMLESERLNARFGCRLLIKPECLQRTGSFKIRGAYNKIASLSVTERKRGIVAFSTGNHAQGVAAAARAMGVKATIVMPSDAPAIKRRNTAEYGAEVVLYDRETEDREQIAKDIITRTGAVLVPPYDDEVIMAGQGTVGLELAEQIEALGATADLLICPAGGGGLIAGVATAFDALSPRTKIFAAEPAHFDDTRRSLSAGKRVGNQPGAKSVCDAILTAIPGLLTFEVNRERLAGGLAVSDNEVIAATTTLFDEMKIVAEPGGAVAFAAIEAGKIDVAGKTVAVVVSGGNVDAESFCKHRKSRGQR